MNNETMNKETLELIKSLKEESRKTFLSVKDAHDLAHACYLQGKAVALKNAAQAIEAANQQ